MMRVLALGDVEAGLDDRRADQHVGLALPEVDHHLLELVLVHLAVRGRDPRLGDELAQPRHDLVDALDSVVDVEDLTLAQQLAPDRGLDLAGRRSGRRRSAPGAAPPAAW